MKDFDKYYARYMHRDITKAGIAKELWISANVDMLIREHKTAEDNSVSQ